MRNEYLLSHLTDKDTLKGFKWFSLSQTGNQDCKKHSDSQVQLKETCLLIVMCYDLKKPTCGVENCVQIGSKDKVAQHMQTAQ